MGKKKHVVFLGYSFFPYGLAEVQKMILISKCLLLTNNKVTVICKNGFHDKLRYPDLKSIGSYEDIEYIYASGSTFRNDSFFKRRLLEVKGTINQLLLLIKMKRKGQLDYAILSTRSFYFVFFHSLLGRLLGYKTILNYVEYYTGIKKEKSQILQRLNDALFDKYAPSLVNAVFPISEFLINHIKKVSPRTKYLKVPVLTDFSRYDEIAAAPNENYFLFCGSAAYKDIIYFIVNSFGFLKQNNSFYLYLVVNGHDHEMAAIKEYIKRHAAKDQIKIFSRLTEKELFTCYKNAKALLIPLQPTFQDMARFPHKTGEYLASGNPVISTNNGEMKHYFKDMENMLLAERFDEKLFAEKMQFVIDHSAEAHEIGLRGQAVALSLFDYRSQASVVDRFLSSD